MQFLVMMSLCACALALSVALIIGYAKTFSKAGLAGWTCIVPIYSFVQMCKIAKQSPWLTLLCFVPLAGLFAQSYIGYKMAKEFNKSEGFCVATIFFFWVTIPMIGFDDSKYNFDAPPSPDNGHQKIAA